jgi:hypothetical protein
MSETESRTAAPSRVVEVGWVMTGVAGGLAWEAPRKFVRNDNASTHAKSVAFCPAVIDHEARLFEIVCPADIEIAFRRDSNQPELAVSAADPAAAPLIAQVFALAPQTEWRHPERPLLQAATPYVFVADEPVFVTQFPPFSFYRSPALPGIGIGGRMPIDGLPHALIWPFEWHDTKRSVALRKGEPLFYVRFETIDPSRPVRFVEGELTPELNACLSDGAKSRRPKQLLAPKKR